MEKGPPAPVSNGVATLTARPLPPMQSIPLSGGPMPGGDIVRGAISRRTPVVEAVAKARPAVVNLSTERIIQTSYSVPILARRAALYDQSWVQEVVLMPLPPRRETKVSLGSGVIVDEHGFILTNNHVIDRASRVHVILDGGDEYDATFVAADEVDDLALIKIDTTNKLLKAIELVENDELLLGETVIAMGNPFGLSHSISVGVLSATNRQATYRGEVLYKDILQTDAAVNPGSSGGPLLDIEGKLLGVNVAIQEEAQNIGFAQPVHRVRELLGRWLSPQVLYRLWLGFTPEWQNGALRVGFVPTNSPALKDGLRVGAVISALNGLPVVDLFDLNRKLMSYKAGDNVNVTWSDAGTVHTSPLTLMPVANSAGNEIAWLRLGLKLQPSVGSAVAPARFMKSLPIDSVRPGSPAARVGLEPGRYIWRIGETEIRQLEDVAEALQNVKAGDTVVLGLVDFNVSEKNIVARQSQVQVVAE